MVAGPACAHSRDGVKFPFAACLALSAPVVCCDANPGSSGQPSPTATDLARVAAQIYPLEGNRYVTCDNGYSGATRYSHCPVTQRLRDRLLTVFAGFISGPEPLGGGQDPEWATRSITVDPSSTGGVAHVVLTKPASPGSRYDLVIVPSKGNLLVDDLYCTSADRATSSIYVAGWMNRFGC